MKVKINKEPIVKCLLYHKEECLGEISSLWQLNDCRIQIKSLYNGEKEESDYWIKFHKHIIPIYKSGSIKNWVDGFYDEPEKQMAKLFKLS